VCMYVLPSSPRAASNDLMGTVASRLDGTHTSYGIGTSFRPLASSHTRSPVPQLNQQRTILSQPHLGRVVSRCTGTFTYVPQHVLPSLAHMYTTAQGSVGRLAGNKNHRDGSFDYSAVFPRFLPPAVPNRRCNDLGSRAFNGWRRRTYIRRVHTLLNPLLWPRSSTRRPPIAITQSTSGAPSPSTGRDAQSSSSRLEPNPIRSTLGGWFAPTLLRAVCANAAACSSREWFAPTSLRAPLTHDAAIHKGIIR
jgi:hypothetical protein